MPKIPALGEVEAGGSCELECILDEIASLKSISGIQ
jgi:hypothetical protein